MNDDPEAQAVFAALEAREEATFLALKASFDSDAMGAAAAEKKRSETESLLTNMEVQQKMLSLTLAGDFRGAALVTLTRPGAEPPTEIEIEKAATEMGEGSSESDKARVAMQLRGMEIAAKWARKTIEMLAEVLARA